MTTRIQYHKIKSYEIKKCSLSFFFFFFFFFEEGGGGGGDGEGQ